MLYIIVYFPVHVVNVKENRQSYYCTARSRIKGHLNAQRYISSMLKSGCKFLLTEYVLLKKRIMMN